MWLKRRGKKDDVAGNKFKKSILMVSQIYECAETLRIVRGGGSGVDIASRGQNCQIKDSRYILLYRGNHFFDVHHAVIILSSSKLRSQAKAAFPLPSCFGSRCRCDRIGFLPLFVLQVCRHSCIKIVGILI